MRNVTWCFSLCALFVVIAPAVTLAQELPFRGNDLLAGERFATSVHAVTGEQDEGKDVGVVRHTGSNKWTLLKQGKTALTVNTNHLAYGKPIYAMLPGRVVGCWRNVPENPPPNLHANYKLGRIPGNGNHVKILQDDGRTTTYAHFQPGTVPTALCPHNTQYVNAKKDAAGNPERYKDGTIVADTKPTEVTNGARVATGQKIGKIGNSGSSSAPHLHVHIQEANGAPSVMRFARGLTTPFPNYIASLDGPWTPLAGGALPKADILIWPPRPAGNVTWNGVDDSAFQRTFEHFVDSGMMPDTISCRNNGATYDSTWVPAQGAFIAHHRMSAQEFSTKKATYQEQGWRVVSQYQCGLVFAAVWRK